MSFSAYDSSLTLDKLCRGHERQYFERKSRRTKPAKIANELIGMLNAGGGVLVYGITDKGQLEDLRFSDEEAQKPHDLDPYRKLLADFIEPPSRIELEEITLPDGALIWLFHVEPEYERLFSRKDNEDVFLRVADSNRGPLKREAVKTLEYNKTMRSFEEEERPDFDPADLDEGQLSKYRQRMSFEGSFEELALKRSLAVRKGDEIVYKNSAILLFSLEPEKYIPSARVRYVRYEGVERQSGSKFNVIKDETFEANIPAVIERLKVFVTASLRDFYFLDLKEGRFKKLPEIPEDAWLEGIVNALCHRSYNRQGNAILLRHFDDRLEIVNSGPLPAQVTTENIASERYSRNPRIARVLADMGFVRELNEGVPRILSAMAELSLEEPTYEDYEGTITLTMRTKVSDQKETILAETMDRFEDNWPSLNPSQHELIRLLIEKHEVTLREMVTRLGKSEQAVRYNLKKLEAIRIVERVSEKKRDPEAIYRFWTGLDKTSGR